MFFDGLKNNIQEMREITRELYIFYLQLENIKKAEKYGGMIIDKDEKSFLNEVTISLSMQLKILNNSIIKLVNSISFHSKIPLSEVKEEKIGLSHVTYKPSDEREQVSLVISEGDKKEFLRNLSISKLSMDQLKKKYSVERRVVGLRKSSNYAKISNYFFRNLSERLVNTGYFNDLNKSLRKMSSSYVLSTYVSMGIFTTVLAFFIGIILFIFLIFLNVSPIFPFFSFVDFSSEGIIERFFKVFWVAIALPVITLISFYFYPRSEAKHVANRINHELPFVTIHLAAISSAGVNPTNMFAIIIKNEEYKYAVVEFKKLLNLINFHGFDVVTALRKSALSSPSTKLAELFNGLAFTIKSGGNIHDFLNEHVETMLFDYKLDRERYIRISETLMDIYISVAISAPMIFLTIFIIISSTGLTGGIFNIGIRTLSFLLILIIALLNIIFLVVLHMKQPPM
ncbi:type II secretion system F family protein [Candidatus Pacearchaeota archaeon]|nr:type II secretion system F family protein [Candidatus Pacearchaeota archaeon]